MQIAGRAVQNDLHGCDTAQRISKRRMLEAGHAGIGNHDGIALEFVTMLLEERLEVRAADFLLAFNQESQIARQLCAGLEIGFDGLEMSEVLAFVVAGAASKQRPAFDPRLERRTFPQLERFRRLDVVVAVDQKMRAIFLSFCEGFSEDDRVAGRLKNIGGEPNSLAMDEDPVGTS